MRFSGAPRMKAVTLGLAVAVSLAGFGAQARSGEKDALIRLIADATAWSEMCVNFAVDPAAIALFRDVHRIPVDGRYIAVFGFAHARSHALAYENRAFGAACDRALALYGPGGSRAPGLVRPLFHGTVPDRKIDLDRLF